MIGLLLAAAVTTTSAEKLNRFCADYVGIPYASDNFTDAEWKQFQGCVNFFSRGEVL